MEATRMHSERCADQPGLGRGLWVTALAAIAAGGACALIYVIASALGAFPDDVLVPAPGGEQSLTLGLVVGTAAIAVPWAAGVFALISLFSRRPFRLFRLVALAVLVVSLGGPFSIDGAPAAMIATLLAMHVVVAAISVGLLTTLLAPRHE